MQGGQSATPDSEKFAKIQEKEGKTGKKEEKSGRKGKNWGGYFTLSLLTDRAGYTTTSAYVGEGGGGAIQIWIWYM